MHGDSKPNINPNCILTKNISDISLQVLIQELNTKICRNSSLGSYFDVAGKI